MTRFGDDIWEAPLPLEPNVVVVEAKEVEDNRDLIDGVVFFWCWHSS